MTAMRFAAFFALMLALGLPLGCGGPSIDESARRIHDLVWRVHVDLIDVGAGRGLAYYTDLITESSTLANRLLQGHQGPFDNGCCVELDTIRVTTFGQPGDGLDVVDSEDEIAAIEDQGAGAYLVQTLLFCSEPVNAIGCAQQPGDVLVVALDSEQFDALPEVIAHERGHNTGLAHVDDNACQLMKASMAGGCLTYWECAQFRAGANATSGTCDCLGDRISDPPEPQGAVCEDVNVCSQGVCDAPSTLAGAELLVAAGAGTSTGSRADDLHLQSAIAGGWETRGAIGSNVSALAWDEAGATLYGIESLPGDDALITIDPATGAKRSTVAVLTDREQITALAFDPRAAGGLLFAIEVDDDHPALPICENLSPSITPPCFSEVVAIDPGTGFQSGLGEIDSPIVRDGITGLAWDDQGSRLYGSTRAGLVAIDLFGCNGSICSAIESIDTVFRESSALTWDAATGLLLREGGNGFDSTYLDAVEPGTGTTWFTIGVDPLTPGGLAGRDARPAP